MYSISTLMNPFLLGKLPLICKLKNELGNNVISLFLKNSFIKKIKVSLNESRLLVYLASLFFRRGQWATSKYLYLIRNWTHCGLFCLITRIQSPITFELQRYFGLIMLK